MKNNYVIKKDALGRTLFCCPKCEKPLIIFYKNTEPIKATSICECGEKVYFGEEIIKYEN